MNVVTCCNGSCTRQGDVIVSDVRQALLQMLLKVVNCTLLLYCCMLVKLSIVHCCCTVESNVMSFTDRAKMTCKVVCWPSLKSAS